MSENGEEWGPWIEHDGRGCPCVGQFVHVVRCDGSEVFAIAGAALIKAGKSPHDPEKSNWAWRFRYPTFQEVIRYRIRKPRGMAILESIVRDVKAPTRQTEDA